MCLQSSSNTERFICLISKHTFAPLSVSCNCCVCNMNNKIARAADTIYASTLQKQIVPVTKCPYKGDNHFLFNKWLYSEQ